MRQTNRLQSILLGVIALFLGMIALRPYLHPEPVVYADSGRFEHVTIVSPMFLYKGSQGVLLLDKRNGNIWFIGKGKEFDLSFTDPVFVVKLPLEKLTPRPVDMSHVKK